MTSRFYRGFRIDRTSVGVRIRKRDMHGYFPDIFTSFAAAKRAIVKAGVYNK